MAVGKTLKETREEKGITIEKASKETKIRKKYILALENDEFDKIPGQVYQKAFLKTYADFLGINKENILEEYQLDQQLSGVEEESLGRSKRRSKKNKKATFFNFVSRITGKAMIIILIVLLLGGVVGYNLIIMDSDNGNNNLTETEEVEQTVEDEGENADDSAGELLLESEANVDTGNDSNESETDENSDNLLETGIDPTDLSDESIQLGEEMVVDLEDEEDLAEISEQELVEENGENGETEEPAENEIEDTPSYFNVIASGESWVRVIVDGDTVFEGIINDGDILEYEPDDEVQIRVGNAAAISVEYGEEVVGPLGGSGQVIEETFQL